MVYWLHRRSPVPRELHLIDGSQMHIDCRGQSAAAVVMEAAASAPWSEWRNVQPELSQITRVCSYDRAGHGWSEPRSTERDVERIVHDLHSLLDKTGVKRPIVLAGHSAGGLYVREYAREFPSEVIGVVLIDSSSPNQFDDCPALAQLHEEDKNDAKFQLWGDRIRVWSGWERRNA